MAGYKSSGGGGGGGGSTQNGLIWYDVDLTSAARVNDPNSFQNGAISFDGTYNTLPYRNTSGLALDGISEGIRFEWDAITDIITGGPVTPDFTSTPFVWQVIAEQGSSNWVDLGVLFGWYRHTGGGNDSIGAGLQARNSGTWYACRASQVLDQVGVAATPSLAAQDVAARCYGYCELGYGIAAKVPVDSQLLGENSRINVVGVDGTVTTEADLYPIVSVIAPTTTDRGDLQARVRIRIAALNYDNL